MQPVAHSIFINNSCKLFLAFYIKTNFVFTYLMRVSYSLLTFITNLLFLFMFCNELWEKPGNGYKKTEYQLREVDKFYLRIETEKERDNGSVNQRWQKEFSNGTKILFLI